MNNIVLYHQRLRRFVVIEIKKKTAEFIFMNAFNIFNVNRSSEIVIPVK